MLVSGSVNDSFAAPGPGRSAETAEQLLDQKPSCVKLQRKSSPVDSMKVDF